MHAVKGVENVRGTNLTFAVSARAYVEEARGMCRCGVRRMRMPIAWKVRPVTGLRHSGFCDTWRRFVAFDVRLAGECGDSEQLQFCGNWNIS